MNYLSALKQHIMDINLPEFMYISGSFALEQLFKSKEELESGLNWSCGDCDVFVDITHSEYSPEAFLSYCMQMLDVDLNSTTKRSVYTDISKMYKYAGKVLIESKLKEIKSILLPEDNNAPALVAQANRAVTNSYLASSNNITRVFKVNFGNEEFKLDFIFIDVDIKTYLTNNFDMSVVRNYINSYGEIVSLNNVGETLNMIASYDYDLFMDRINDYVRANLANMVKRINKYESRGFKIYIKPYWLECECEEANCLCAIRFDMDFIKFFFIGALFVSSRDREADDRYFRFARCCLENGHEGECESWSQFGCMNRTPHVEGNNCGCRHCTKSRPEGSKVCGHYALPSYYIKYLNAFDMNVSKITANIHDYYLNGYEQVFRKHVMQRELLLSHSLHPFTLMRLGEFDFE